MLDTHCHILPKLDDGPKSIEESLQMGRQAMKQGITGIICTPHHSNGKYENQMSFVEKETNQLQNIFDQERIEIRLYSGQEVHMTHALLQEVETGRVQMIHQKKYFLLEFPSTYVPMYSGQYLDILVSKGCVPVIVHPERNLELSNNLDKLKALVDRGAVVQITAPSYIGKYGKKTQQVCKKMIKKGLVHLIASDAHGLNRRPFSLLQAQQHIVTDFGVGQLAIFNENASRILNGEAMLSE